MNDGQESEIVDIEIQLKVSGLSEAAVDAPTRQLATQLRLIPHQSVGIISKQTPESANESSRATEGAIAMSLSAAHLPAVVKLLQKDKRFILRGSNGTVLDLGLASPEQVNIWLNAVGRRAIVQSGSESNATTMSEQAALPSVQDLRAHARHHIESGAVTEQYLADRQQVITVLNQVLATELICVLRYKSHYYRASGVNSEPIKAEFSEHAREADQHVDLVASRIVQLNGAPDFNPEGLATRSRSEFILGATLTEMIKEDLIAERIAVEFYSAIIRWLDDSDLTTRKLMQEILAVEVQHAEDMKLLLGKLAV